eukprot:scaffold79620_cov13-Tisochrysis_lutea.AAC.1
MGVDKVQGMNQALGEDAITLNFCASYVKLYISSRVSQHLPYQAWQAQDKPSCSEPPAFDKSRTKKCKFRQRHRSHIGCKNTFSSLQKRTLERLCAQQGLTQARSCDERAMSSKLACRFLVYVSCRVAGRLFLHNTAFHGCQSP